MKRKSVIIVILATTLLASSARQPQSAPARVIGVKKVVIDAGHGGHDPGAVGVKNKESAIALSIALKVGGLIKENFPDVEVIYTRKTDVFVELYNRAKIANDCKADLFISIHCNASKSVTATGTETWVMGLNKSLANLEVAKAENATILLENDYTNQYDGFDPNSAEANIIFSLYQNIFLDQSLNLAAKVQNQFEKRVGRVNRGVKQAGFLVLYKTTMPGILIETGFISNLDEEEYLASGYGQDLISSAIYRSFKAYKSEIEDGSNEDESIEDDDIDTVLVNSQQNPVIDTTNNIPVLKDTTKVVQEIFFRVQFATNSTKKSINSPEYKSLTDVRVYFHAGLYKYTTGNLLTLEDAVILQHEVQQKGFKDAFVIAFLNEQRITPSEAVQMLKNQKK